MLGLNGCLNISCSSFTLVDRFVNLWPVLRGHVWRNTRRRARSALIIHPVASHRGAFSTCREQLEQASRDKHERSTSKARDQNPSCSLIHLEQAEHFNLIVIFVVVLLPVTAAAARSRSRSGNLGLRSGRLLMRTTHSNLSCGITVSRQNTSAGVVNLIV